MNHGAAPVLAVDLDGTLLKSDSLWESLFCMVTSHPWRLLTLPFRLAEGKAALKSHLARDFPAQAVAFWPYNPDVIAAIHQAKAEGHRVCLATATHATIAQAVAKHIGAFDQVLATSDNDNLRGGRKLSRLQESFGANGFDYIGDSPADLPVWANCRQATLVGDGDSALARQVAAVNPHLQVIPAHKPGIREYFRAIRIRQWLKNTLIPAPLFLAWDFTAANILGVFLALVAFSFCASAVYVLNDLIDLPFDRRHPAKCRRPFASGAIPLWQGAGMALLLSLLTVAAASLLPRPFQILLLGYFILSFVYSYWLKRIIMLDVIVLAGFYVMRLLAGIVAIDIGISNWLLGFGSFVFLGLALIKRVSDLMLHKRLNSERSHGRSYQIGDIGVLEHMATACGYCSIAILALYIDSMRATSVYARPYLLWAVCPILAYWYGHMLILLHRGEMHHDPVEFILTDKASLASVVAGMVMFAAAI